MLICHGIPREARSAGSGTTAAGAWTLDEIADSLGVSKSSVSLWVRGVEFERRPRRTARRREPNVLQRRKAAQIEELQRAGILRLGCLSEQAFLAAGVALYAGEGAKRDGTVQFANGDARMVAYFCAWLRHFFEVDESRLTVRVYLHDGLDLDAAQRFWSDRTGIPVSQFHKSYRAIPDATIRTTKHEYGCAYVFYCCSKTHRAIMGLIDALLAWNLPSGVAQSAEQGPVKPKVEGPSPSPGAGGQEAQESLL